MKIILDNRESAFIEIFREKSVNHPNITWTIAQLSLGDMELYNDQDELLFVWERKTFSDLLSSIKDGRYKEQSYRLEHIHGSAKVIYLIEGIMSQLREHDKKIVISALTSISLKKRFHVWRSVNVHDSVQQFLGVCDKIAKDIAQGVFTYNTIHEVSIEAVPSSAPASYGTLVKKNKKENITPENIGEIFLCQIPDVSTASANALMKYADGNFSQLMSIIQETPELLVDIKIEGPKPRKISKRVLTNIRTFLGVRPLSEDSAPPTV
jgi:ERCC4-type nuclease